MPPSDTSVLLLTTVLAAAWVVLLTLAETWWRARRRDELLVSAPATLLAPVPSWPGMRPACVVVGLLLLGLLCYELIVPFEAWPGGFRFAAFARAAAGGACAAAILVQVGRRWSTRLTEEALGLLTLAACTLATVGVPDEPQELSRRYPLIFTALVCALAFMTWFWVWLAQVWEQQLDAAPPPGHEPAWTTAGRLVPVQRDFGLATGLGGGVVAAALAVWPMLPTSTVGRVSSWELVVGLAAHLGLLVVVVRCARRTRPLACGVLGLLVFLSTAVFVVVRVI